jgi:hypothetical protein
MADRPRSKMRKHILIATTSFAALGSTGCLSQELGAEDSVEVSRQEWQAKVRASRARADVMRHERRGLVPQAPTPDELAKEASRRALEDDSLLPGDIVSTNRGLFQFRGQPGGERKRDDFVRIR